MKTSESLKAIAPALLKAQMGIKAAIKDTANPFFKSKYADLESVVDAVKGPLNENGILFIQGVSGADHGVAVETMLLHESGEFMSETLTLPVLKNDAQGVGSAITYGRRYGLQAICGVPSVDDDGNAAAGNTPKIDKKTGEVQPTRIAAASGAVAALEPAKQEMIQRKVSEIVDLWNNSQKDEAFKIWHAGTTGDADEAVALTEGLGKFAAIRNTFKKMASELNQKAA